MMRAKTKYLYMMIVWSLVVLLKSFDCFLLFTKVRSFYVILVESFKDSKPFLVIFGYICFIFALITSLLIIGVEGKTQLLELFMLAIIDSLGGFPVPEEEEIADDGKRSVSWVMLLLIILVLNIIGLNSLIAIIGDSYDRV